MTPLLKLGFRRDYDTIAAALDAANDRLPPGWPNVLLLGYKVLIPGVPEVVVIVVQEFLARGLTRLAARAGDPMRWRV